VLSPPPIISQFQHPTAYIQPTIRVLAAYRPLTVSVPVSAQSAYHQRTSHCTVSIQSAYSQLQLAFSLLSEYYQFAFSAHFVNSLCTVSTHASYCPHVFSNQSANRQCTDIIHTVYRQPTAAVQASYSHLTVSSLKAANSQLTDTILAAFRQHTVSIQTAYSPLTGGIQSAYTVSLLAACR